MLLFGSSPSVELKKKNYDENEKAGVWHNFFESELAEAPGHMYALVCFPRTLHEKGMGQKMFDLIGGFDRIDVRPPP